MELSKFPGFLRFHCEMCVCVLFGLTVVSVFNKHTQIDLDAAREKAAQGDHFENAA